MLMTAERNSEDWRDHVAPIEEFVADNVVILRNALYREKPPAHHRSPQDARQPSYRGRGALHTARAEGDGRGSPVLAAPRTAFEHERVTSGNAELDQMCGGGLFRDSVTAGERRHRHGQDPPGHQLSSPAAVAGGRKRDLLVGYEESKGQLFRNARGWGIDFPAMEAEGKLKDHLPPSGSPGPAGPPAHDPPVWSTKFRPEPNRGRQPLGAGAHRPGHRASANSLISLTSFIKKREIAGLCTRDQQVADRRRERQRAAHLDPDRFDHPAALHPGGRSDESWPDGAEDARQRARQARYAA